MDFALKSAWIYKDKEPDVLKAKNHGIRVVYVDPTSSNLAKVLAELKGAGITGGAYFADSWTTAPADTFADWVSSLLNQHFPRGTAVEAPPCMLDIERADKVWAAEVVKRYRTHQPMRPTSYTNAPFQGGNWPWDAIKAAGMHVYPQLYLGDMTACDPAAVVLEAARYMGDASKVHPFYDGARFGTDHRDGCYYTLERMP